MSRLADLLQELCPNGVEYLPLSRLGTIFKGMSGVSNKWSDEGNCQFIDYKNVYTHVKVDVSDLPFATVRKMENQFVLNTGDILFTSASETPDECAISSVIEDKIVGGIFLDDHLFGIRINSEIGNSTYFNYYFRSTGFRKDVNKAVRGVTRFYISMPEFAKISIPVPPLEVQREIVRILDNFTELTAELTARKKQYEYYRNQLLTFGEDGPMAKWIQECCPNGVEYKEISTVCSIARGRVISKGYIKQHIGEYPVYSSQTESNGVFGKIDTYMYDGEYLTWTTDGANAGTVFYRKGKFNITNVCGLLKPQEGGLLIKYLYYILSIEAPKYVSSGMGNPKLMSNVMGRIKVPVPPLAVQARIVAILDRFEALCSDLSAGLPAEIEARRRQYAYYRDKLLTFRRVSA